MQSKCILPIRYKYFAQKIHKNCTFYVFVCKFRHYIMLNLAIFASGSGSNAENIADYFFMEETHCVKAIISNKADALVHKRAEKLNVESVTFSKTDFDSSEKVLDYLKKQQIDFIILAGFLLKVPHNLLEAYPHKIVNIHPALLPKFGGKGMYGDNVHKAVIAAGEKESGITIHYINENYDEGDIIFQAKCDVEDGDTFQDVATKVHELEYMYYPQIIDAVLDKEFPKTR